MKSGKKVLLYAIMMSAFPLVQAECDGTSGSAAEGTCNKERGDKKCNSSGDCCPGRQCNSFGFCEYCR